MTRFLFSLALMASHTAWAVPTQLGHQGRVLDEGDSPMEGTQTLTFRLYDALESGTLAWEESHTVYLDNGFYSVVLGADEANNPIDALLLDGGSLYLELQVQGESPLEPRHVLTSVPYSVVAGTSTNVAGGTVDASTIRVNGAEVIDSSGAWVGASTGIDEATVEDYITNGAIDLHAGTTIGGGECLVADSSGNVGIGNTTPTEALDVTGNIIASGTICDTNGCVGSGGSGTSPWSQSGQDISYSTGSVGIGTSSPGQALEVASSTNDYVGGIILLTDTTTMAEGVGGGITFRGKYSTVTTEFAAIRAAKSNGTSGNYDADMAFFTRTNGEGNQGERMRIDSSGNVGIGTTSPTSSLDIEAEHPGITLRTNDADGDPQLKFVDSVGSQLAHLRVDNTGGSLNYVSLNAGTSENHLAIDSSGNVGIGTTTPTRLLHVAGDVQVDGVVYETSDARLKDDIDPIVGATDRVAGIQGVTWAYDREGNDNERYVGVLAQDVAEVLPEAVRTAQDGSLAVNYNGLVGLLVEAVKEQQVALAARDKDLAAFEARLRKLEER